MNNPEELNVFQLSHELTLMVYAITEKFPQSEQFGITSQIRRCTSSIPSNIMEGSHRLNRKEYRHFIGIARGSAGELKYHLLLSRDLKYIDENIYLVLREKIETISKMLTKLAASLSEKKS